MTVTPSAVNCEASFPAERWVLDSWRTTSDDVRLVLENALLCFLPADAVADEIRRDIEERQKAADRRRNDEHTEKIRAKRRAKANELKAQRNRTAGTIDAD